MALLFAEHTLTFTVVTEETDGDGVVQIPEEGSSEDVTGQLSSMTASAAYERFGVDLTRPHSFLYELADEDNIKVGYKAEYGDRVFEVSAPPMKNAAGGDFADLDYMECVLEEREIV
jgi:hypothetical protein